MRISLKNVTCIRSWMKNTDLESPASWSRRKLFYRQFSCSMMNENTDTNETSSSTYKTLKVAIIGTPNAGKSTLINQIIGRTVFAISAKVHTTRCSARAVAVTGKTQLVFLDTPGIVSVKESIRHRLERSFIVDSEEAVREADVVGVLHDVSNKYTVNKLDSKIIRLLYLYPKKHTFLILNKIDAMSHRRDLLNCVRILTMQDEVGSPMWGSRKSEAEIQDICEQQDGWHNFKDVFMISAINGDGVGDIHTYLLKLAKPGEWLFDKSFITDQKETNVVQNIVTAKLMDFLPNAVPYTIKVELEYFHKTAEGGVIAVVLLHVKNIQVKYLVQGAGGNRIRSIAKAVEHELRQFFFNDVRITLVLREIPKGIKEPITVVEPDSIDVSPATSERSNNEENVNSSR